MVMENVPSSYVSKIVTSAWWSLIFGTAVVADLLCAALFSALALEGVSAICLGLAILSFACLWVVEWLN